MFHVNEIDFGHLESVIKVKTKGPGAMHGGTLLNTMKSIQKTSINDLISRHHLKIFIARMARLYIRAKIQWFSEQKRTEVDDSSLRSDQMCMLVFAGYLNMDESDNLKHLEYKQEEISHAWWITTANGYLFARCCIWRWTIHTFPKASI